MELWIEPLAKNKTKEAEKLVDTPDRELFKILSTITRKFYRCLHTKKYDEADRILDELPSTPQGTALWRKLTQEVALSRLNVGRITRGKQTKKTAPSRSRFNPPEWEEMPSEY